jgi:alpha-galactosidase
MRAPFALLAITVPVALACGAPVLPAPSGAAPPAADAGTADAGVNDAPKPVAATPPMGWNDWAPYQCDVNEQIVADNAQALVKSGHAGKG